MMKRRITSGILMLLVAVFTLGTTSCDKYEDGPEFSLLTKKARLAGEWNSVDVVNEAGVSQTTINEPNLKIEKDGRFTFDYTGGDYVGTWEWIDNKEAIEVKIDFNGIVQIYKYEILQLKNKNLKLKDKDGWISIYEGI